MLGALTCTLGCGKVRYKKLVLLLNMVHKDALMRMCIDFVSVYFGLLGEDRDRSDAGAGRHQGRRR